MADSVLRNFRSYSDEALAALARAGDRQALSVLVARYVFTVRGRAGNYAGSGLDPEDLSQEGMIGLMQAVRSYDPDCGAKFRTFAWLCIDRSIISAIKATLRKKQIPKGSLVFVGDDDDMLAENNADNNPESFVIAKESMQSLMRNISDVLTPFEQDVLRLYLAGNPYSAIARELGCPEKAVDNALQRLRRKLR